MFRLVACASAALASAGEVGYHHYVDQYAAGGFGAGRHAEASNLLAMGHPGTAGSSDKGAPSGGGSAGGDFSKYIPGGGGAAGGGGDFMKKYMPGGDSSNSSAGGFDFEKFIKQFGPGSFGGGKDDSKDDKGALSKIETAPTSAESCHNMSCLTDWKGATDGMVKKFGANNAEGKSFWNKFVQSKYAENKARIEKEEANRSLSENSTAKEEANRSLAENSTAKDASEPKTQRDKANSSSGKEARRDEASKGESSASASLAAAPESLAAASGDSDVVYSILARGLLLAALAAVAVGMLARAWRGTQVAELEGSDSADYYQIAA